MEEPVCIRYKLDDVTPEAIARFLQHNPRSGTLIRPELSGWIAAMEPTKTKREPKRGSWPNISGSTMENLTSGIEVGSKATGGLPHIYIKASPIGNCGHGTARSVATDYFPPKY